MKIGFIGLGLMGRGMAQNILNAGFSLFVHDLNHDAAADFIAQGAQWCDTPNRLAQQVDVVFTSLPKPTDVLSVLHSDDGLHAGLAEGKIWLDLSTNSLTVVRGIYDALSPQGVHFLDAPVSGGPAGAASGKLAIWVGGPQCIYDQITPVLTAMADRARRVGDIGAGTISKLVHNTMASTINHVVSEMMTVGVKAGMDPLDLYEAIRSGAMGRMRAFDNVHPRWLAGNLDPATFALELLHKDVALGVELANSVNAPAPLATLTRDDLAEAVNRGWGKRDAQAALVLKQERAGIEPISADINDIRSVMDRS